MANYQTKARRKDSTSSAYEDVEMLDNYFGLHIYGVRFPNGDVLEEKDCASICSFVDERSSYTGNTEIYRDTKLSRLQKLIKLIKKIWKK
jgi:hypothetical protein